MKRITIREPDTGKIFIAIKQEIREAQNKDGSKRYLVEYEEDPFERLAEYEDTGLTPKEITDRIKVGIWIKNDGDEDFHCSVCGNTALGVCGDQILTPYCGMCGAELELSVNKTLYEAIIEPMEKLTKRRFGVEVHEDGET